MRFTPPLQVTSLLQASCAVLDVAVTAHAYIVAATILQPCAMMSSRVLSVPMVNVPSKFTYITYHMTISSDIVTSSIIAYIGSSISTNTLIIATSASCPGAADCGAHPDIGRAVLVPCHWPLADEAPAASHLSIFPRLLPRSDSH